MTRSFIVSLALASATCLAVAALAQAPGTARPVAPHAQQTTPGIVLTAPGTGNLGTYYSLDWTGAPESATARALTGNEKTTLTWVTPVTAGPGTPQYYVQIQPRVQPPASKVAIRNLLYTPADRAKTRVSHPLMTQDIRVQVLPLKKPAMPKR